MTSFGIGVSPIPDPASMLMKYLLRFVKLPTGIEDMGTKSGWLRGFNKGRDLKFAMVCIGADYERGLQPESAGVKALGRLRRLFEAAGSAENDLVVQVSSATARGTACAMEESSGHFEYLAKDEVEAMLISVILG
jgi:hypothetical protein